MKRAKKTVPKRQLRDGIVQGLRRGQTIAKILYHIPGKMQAPIRAGEGVPSPVTGLELFLVICGTGWLVACMFRIVTGQDI